MIWLKACQRCGGDLFREADDFGSFWLCLQCGFQRDVPCLVPYDTNPKSQPQQAAPGVLIVAQTIEVIRSVEKTAARLGLEVLHKPIRLAKVESMLRRLGQCHNSKASSTTTVRPNPFRSPG